MNNNMYIDVEKLNGAIDKLKSNREKIYNIFSTQKANVKKLSEVWNGSTGEKINAELTTHNSYYDNYIARLDEKISFLEKTRDSYLKNDSLLDKKIDENAK